MSDDIRPTGRELRLVNAAIALVTFLDPRWMPPGIVLTDPALMKIEELREAAGLYKKHMLKPEMNELTLIPVPVKFL